MKTITVDFNARDENDCVRLNTAGTETSEILPDEWVWLTDEEVLVIAKVLEGLVARPVWETVIYCEGCRKCRMQ